MTRKDAIRRIVVEIMKERSRAGAERPMTLEQWEGFISAILYQVDEQSTGAAK